MTGVSLKSELTYVRNLVEAGWNGARSARRKADGTGRTPARALLAPAAIAAGIGALSTSFGKGRRSGKSLIVAGCIGSAVGLSAGVAWASRGSAGPAARGAIREINAVRDARWLEKHPIAYA